MSAIDNRGQLISIKQVCSMLGVSDRTVDRMVERGELPAPIRVGQRLKRWRSRDIETHLAELENCPPRLLSGEEICPEPKRERPEDDAEEWPEPPPGYGWVLGWDEKRDVGYRYLTALPEGEDEDEDEEESDQAMEPVFDPVSIELYEAEIEDAVRRRELQESNESKADPTSVPGDDWCF